MARLNSARSDFYAGRVDQAAEKLAEVPKTETDRVLYLMERGTINQARADYRESSYDYMKAVELAEQLDYYSISRGAASMVVNDRTLAYRGTPYERVLLHAFGAYNYLALGLWDDAAVEARNIIDRMQNLNGFPDDAYSRYLAGFCLEAAGDSEGAAFQYRSLAEPLKGLGLDPATGRLAGSAPAGSPLQGELVVFVMVGRGPTGTGDLTAAMRWGKEPFAEIYAGDRYLGRSCTLTTTARLYSDTQKRLATLQVVKTATRIVVKDQVARAVAEENDLLGMLLWLVLFSAEQPDTRRWETLPCWLQVARVPCPLDLSEYRIVFKNSGGAPLGTRVISAPLVRRGKLFVSFCRDAP